MNAFTILLAFGRCSINGSYDHCYEMKRFPQCFFAHKCELCPGCSASCHPSLSVWRLLPRPNGSSAHSTVFYLLALPVLIPIAECLSLSPSFSYLLCDSTKVSLLLGGFSWVPHPCTLGSMLPPLLHCVCLSGRKWINHLIVPPTWVKCVSLACN